MRWGTSRDWLQSSARQAVSGVADRIRTVTPQRKLRIGMFRTTAAPALGTAASTEDRMGIARSPGSYKHPAPPLYSVRAYPAYGFGD